VRAAAETARPRRWPQLLLLVAVCLAISIFAAACSGGDEAATTNDGSTTTLPVPPTETTAPEAEAPTGSETHASPEPAGSMPMGAGHELYVQAGCGGCHGENAEGTEIGPALPGHGEAVVIRQVRTPLDKMPSYTAARLSDDDLHEIAEYIASLAPEETHVEPVKLSDLSATHHWMALSAIEAGDLKDALHHVNHIVDLVKGEHLTAMKEAREHLEAGDAHEAEHLIEEMLAKTAKPDLTLKRLHLQLALTAVGARDTKEAIHQTRHFVALVKGKPKQNGLAVIKDLEAGDLHEAEHGIERLLGEKPHEG